jgi:hypothetical protein
VAFESYTKYYGTFLFLATVLESHLMSFNTLRNQYNIAHSLDIKYTISGVTGHRPLYNMCANWRNAATHSYRFALELNQVRVLRE